MGTANEFLKRGLSRRNMLRLGAAAALAPLTPAFAEPAGDPLNVGSLTSIAPRLAMQGKLATKTEIMKSQGQAPMLGAMSLHALDGAINQYQDIVANGGWQELPPGRYDQKSKPGSIQLLRQRLIAEGYLDFDALAGPSSSKWDTGLQAAIKAFQFNHGALPSGIIDERTRQELNISADARLYTLQENAPRIIEHLRDLGPRYVAVNIPSAQLETVEHGQIWSRHNVVCGKVDRPSPSLKSRASDIVFNPTWNAPASIVEKDIIPKMLADHTYLEKLDIHIYDGVNGPEINPKTVDWSTTPADRYVFVQNPGEQNSLAQVKVNFPNKFMVYMHDTPHRELFATNDRWESSGCVRVDQVRHLITWLMNGQDGYDEENFDPIIESRQKQIVKLQTQTDIRFMYLTAWATMDGRVNFRPDIYKLDGKNFILGQPDPLIDPSKAVAQPIVTGTTVPIVKKPAAPVAKVTSTPVALTPHPRQH